MPRDVFYPRAALVVILAQRCHMNLLCFPALLVFPSRCETWKSSLWMRMAHSVGRVSSWGFVSHSPIKSSLDEGEEVTPKGQSCVLQSPGSNWRSWAFVYWGPACVQGEIMLSLRTE